MLGHHVDLSKITFQSISAMTRGHEEFPLLSES